MTLSLTKFYDAILPQAKAARIPLSGQFEITPRCNLGCKMCYIAKHRSDSTPLPGELSAADWIRLAGEAQAAGMMNLLLTGGEVFMRRDFQQLLEELKRMGLLIKIYSNGTLITRDLAAWLGRMKPLSMEVTLYGASPETYERVTGSYHAFKLALQGIDNLIGQGITLQLRTTVVRDNYRDFYEIARIADERQLKLGIINYIKPARPETGRNSEPLRLPPALQINYETEIEDYFARKSQSEKLNINYEEYNVDQANTPDDNQFTAYLCLAGQTAFWVTWQGEMLPCSSIAGTGIFPLNDGFKQAWAQIGDFCRATPVCSECLSCVYKKWCLSCPARLKIETGAFDRPAPYLCELARRKSGLL